MVTVEIEWVHIYGIIFAWTGVGVGIKMASSGPAKLFRSVHCAPCFPGPLLRQKRVDMAFHMKWCEVMYELLHDEMLCEEDEEDLCLLGAAHLACGWGVEHGQSVFIHGEADCIDDGSSGESKV